MTEPWIWPDRLSIITDYTHDEMELSLWTETETETLKNSLNTDFKTIKQT